MDHTPSQQAAKTIEIRAPPAPRRRRPAAVTWLESAHFIGRDGWIEFGQLLGCGGGESPVVGLERDSQRWSAGRRRASQAAAWVGHGARCRASRCSARGSCSSGPTGRAALSDARGPGAPSRRPPQCRSSLLASVPRQGPTLSCSRLFSSTSAQADVASPDLATAFQSRKGQLRSPLN